MWRRQHTVSSMGPAARLRAATLALSNTLRRSLSAQTNGEVRITDILKSKFPHASAIKVVDISGGCGAMYEVHIESVEFKGKRVVQQHQMINQALKDEIQAMHGLRIFTAVPKVCDGGEDCR
ncbi:bolA-like protein 3 [Chiloscyllium punctatum]|uniref:bolA-like protein 3 n=1 Tax=Chiloscyllium punctatum TaxID=137246 RepID=UPI003B638FF6